MSYRSDYSQDTIERLEKLSQLKEKGVITEEEFIRMKRDIIASSQVKINPTLQGEDLFEKEGKNKFGLISFLVVLIIGAIAAGIYFLLLKNEKSIDKVLVTNKPKEINSSIKDISERKEQIYREQIVECLKKDYVLTESLLSTQYIIPDQAEEAANYYAKNYHEREALIKTIAGFQQQDAQEISHFMEIENNFVKAHVNFVIASAKYHETFIFARKYAPNGSSGSIGEALSLAERNLREASNVNDDALAKVKEYQPQMVKYGWEILWGRTSQENSRTSNATQSTQEENTTVNPANSTKDTSSVYNTLEQQIISKTPLDKDLLDRLSIDDLERLDMTIYAFYGYDFFEPEYKEYFSRKPWYNISENFNKNMLTDMDKENEKVLRNIKSAKISLEQELPLNTAPCGGSETYEQLAACWQAHINVATSELNDVMNKIRRNLSEKDKERFDDRHMNWTLSYVRDVEGLAEKKYDDRRLKQIAALRARAVETRKRIEELKRKYAPLLVNSSN